jgi:putative transposase
VAAFRNRPLEVAYPYLWLDAPCLKGRQNHRTVNMAVVLAVGMRDTREREILVIDFGASEEEAFWTTFLRGLVGRGLKGVQLVVSDAHERLKSAMAGVLTGDEGGATRARIARLSRLSLLPRGPGSVLSQRNADGDAPGQRSHRGGRGWQHLH